MIEKEKVMDDVARLAGSTVSALSSLSKTVKRDVRSRVDNLAERMNWVPREDFDNLEVRVRDLLAEQALLKAEIESLKKKAPAPAAASNPLEQKEKTVKAKVKNTKKPKAKIAAAKKKPAAKKPAAKKPAAKKPAAKKTAAKKKPAVKKTAAKKPAAKKAAVKKKPAVKKIAAKKKPAAKKTAAKKKTAARK